MAIVFSQGTTLKKGATVIGQIKSISHNRSVGTIDTTVLADTAKQYEPGLPDAGEVTFSLQYHPVDHAALSAVCLAILNLDEALTRE